MSPAPDPPADILHAYVQRIAATRGPLDGHDQVSSVVTTAFGYAVGSQIPCGIRTVGTRHSASRDHESRGYSPFEGTTPGPLLRPKATALGKCSWLREPASIHCARCAAGRGKLPVLAERLTLVVTAITIDPMGRERSAKKTPLVKWIDESGMTRREFAEKLDVAETSLNRLCRGERRPSLELAFAIEKLTKGAIPASYWQAVPKHSGD